MFLAKRLMEVARQTCFINNLSTSIRSLSVTQPLVQKPFSAGNAVADQTEKHSNVAEKKECDEVIANVNQQLASQEQGRMFAVVHLCGKQFKITAGDIILVEGYWPPTIGDEIRLEKVLLAGAKDFTVIGRPILATGLVDIKATVIEKTLTHTKTIFKKKRRKQYQRINFQRSPNTMIRINSIEMAGIANESVNISNRFRLF